MGMQFEIQYEENPHGVFFTGQLVRGRAIVKLDEAVLVKGVRIKVRGYAEVRWDESTTVTNSDGTTSTVSDTHSDKIEYFNAITECIDTKGQELNLEPGVHTYTFECPLPVNCPSSFKGNYGRVHYETKITLVRPRKFNKSYSMGFNVLQIVDLNHYPSLVIPASMEIFKTFCCGPCKSNPLILIMSLPQTGYAPGEIIHVNAKFVNNSSTKVEQLRIALNLIAFHRVRKRVSTKTQKFAIVKSKFGGIEKKIFEVKDKLQVPPTPPTCEQDLCEILQISYEVELTAKVKGAHISPTVAIPVRIGSIPLVSRSAQFSEDALIANLRNGIIPGQQSNSDIELPPPSYEEALYMREFSPTAPQKENEDIHFERYSPRYPVYTSQFPCLAMQ